MEVSLRGGPGDVVIGCNGDIGLGGTKTVVHFILYSCSLQFVFWCPHLNISYWLKIRDVNGLFTKIIEILFHYLILNILIGIIFFVLRGGAA